MYGFSGYGTNAYATPRHSSGILGPVVVLAMRVLKNTYGIAEGLMLKFRNSTLTKPTGNTNTTLEL
jgi:hypothetical protein